MVQVIITFCTFCLPPNLRFEFVCLKMRLKLAKIERSSFILSICLNEFLLLCFIFVCVCIHLAGQRRDFIENKLFLSFSIYFKLQCTRVHQLRIKKIKKQARERAFHFEMKWNSKRNRLFKWRIHQGYVFAFKSNRNQFHYDQSELEIYLNETQKSDVEPKKRPHKWNNQAERGSVGARDQSRAALRERHAQEGDENVIKNDIFFPLPSHTSQWESSRKKDIALLNIMFSSGRRIKTKRVRTTLLLTTYLV